MRVLHGREIGLLLGNPLLFGSQAGRVLSDCEISLLLCQLLLFRSQSCRVLSGREISLLFRNLAALSLEQLVQPGHILPGRPHLPFRDSLRATNEREEYHSSCAAPAARSTHWHLLTGG